MRDRIASVGLFAFAVNLFEPDVILVVHEIFNPIVALFLVVLDIVIGLKVKKALIIVAWQIDDSPI